VTDFHRLLADLTRSRVEFLIVGGFAATAHGSAFLTVDLDVVYRRTIDNIPASQRRCSLFVRICAAHRQGCLSHSMSRPCAVD
jgi:hypothetical protein